VWWRFDGQVQGAVQGKECMGPSLAITAILFLEFTKVFQLSVSMKEVASEYPFCKLISMNPDVFQMYFISFIFLFHIHKFFNISQFILFYVILLSKTCLTFNFLHP